MSYFDTLSKHQQAYRAKREQQYQQALDCIKEAGIRGIHKKGVHRKTGIREHVLNRMVDDMHARKLIHVAGWTMERSTFTALLAIGDLPDVPRVVPTITPKAHRQKERRQGTVAMNEEEQLKAAVESKHRAWAKNWKPHRDAAAAWF
ncbi:hypothetical protein E5S69_11770 [Cupriavidus necator]|uniref:hypothetical protein n=1 Tax=Cupriavidus necator TaxID=106590 RepID=UPI00148F7D95|nr:hypothetical protein [Cupriavidus necator]NOV24189.1 hypothetical protein [Cupriavidus necator]